MIKKIIGVTVGTSLPKPNFDQTDPRKGDYIKGDRSFLNMDDTLTIAGRPADAKATGDAINKVQTNIDEITISMGDLDNKYYTESEIDTMVADLNTVIDAKSDADHNHDDVYYTETEIDNRLGEMQTNIDSKVDIVDGKGLSTNDYTDADKDKLDSIEAEANFYEHPEHISRDLGLYKVTVDELGHISDVSLVEKEDIVALGIPEQDTTYDEEISDLTDRIDGIENDINTINETLSGVSEEFESYKITNNEAVATNASGIQDNKDAIEAIQEDYLTSTDKEQLQDSITEVSDKAAENAAAIEILNGEGDGSVKQSIDNAFNEFAANVTNDDVINTYKELIDYAAQHGPEFTELVGEVDTINTHLDEVEADLASHKTTVADQFAEVDTTINNHATNTDNPHSVTKEQVGLGNVDNTADLDKPVSNATQEALDEKANLEHTHEVEEVNGLQDLADALQVNIDTHVADENNPHGVTPEQIGAYTKEEVDAQIESLYVFADVDSDGVLFFNFYVTAGKEKITSTSDGAGNVRSYGLMSSYNNDNVTMYGFNSSRYEDGNVTIS